MTYKTFFGVTCATIAALLMARTLPAAPLVPKDAHWYTYIDTQDGKVIDTDFATSLSNAVGGKDINANYHFMAGVFGECSGGGMVGELTGFSFSSFTSAAQWNEASWSTFLDPQVDEKDAEGAYLQVWSNAVNAANTTKMVDAYTTANAKDPAGPVLKTYQSMPDYKKHNVTEHPQYTSSSAVGDAITLHGTTTAYAILFGGGKNSWANYNSIVHMHDVLVNTYNYAAAADSEIYAMYPGTKKPDGTALPAWLNHTANAVDLAKAFLWLKGKTTSSTDVFYWNSQQDGGRAEKVKPQMEGGAKGVNFQLDSAYVDYYNDHAFTGERYIDLEYNLPTPDQLFLNGNFVAALPAGPQSLHIVLNPLDDPVSLSDVLAIGSSSPNTFDYFTTVDIGIDGAGLAVPEPNSLALLALGATSLFSYVWRERSSKAND
jgi:hypothetical protein